jgi:hypothetical protein
MLLHLARYLNQSLAALVGEIRAIEEPPILGQLKFSELATNEAVENGLYVFRSLNPSAQWLYVGKASSRSFLGRMSAHCDPREDYALNNFAKAIWRMDKTPSFRAALDQALEAHVVLIPAAATCTPGLSGKERGVALERLERQLQAYGAGTKYNRGLDKVLKREPETRVGEILAA